MNEHNDQPNIEIPNILPPQRIFIEEKKLVNNLHNHHLFQYHQVQHPQPKFIYSNNHTQNNHFQKVIHPVPNHKITYFDQPKPLNVYQSNSSLSDLSINKSHSNTMVTLTNQT